MSNSWRKKRKKYLVFIAAVVIGRKKKVQKDENRKPQKAQEQLYLRGWRKGKTGNLKDFFFSNPSAGAFKIRHTLQPQVSRQNLYICIC